MAEQTVKSVLDLPLCIDPNIDLSTFDGLINLLEGFIAALPKFILPTIIPKIPEFPGAAFEIVLEGLDSTKVPSFSIPELGVSFKGVNGLGIEVFSPDGLIKFIEGLIKIPTGLPNLFFDTSTVPPTPKIPNFDAILTLISDSLGLTLVIPPFPGRDEFIAKFARCIAQVVAASVGIPTSA